MDFSGIQLQRIANKKHIEQRFEEIQNGFILIHEIFQDIFHTASIDSQLKESFRQYGGIITSYYTMLIKFLEEASIIAERIKLQFTQTGKEQEKHFDVKAFTDLLQITNNNLNEEKQKQLELLENLKNNSNSKFQIQSEKQIQTFTEEKNTNIMNSENQSVDVQQELNWTDSKSQDSKQVKSDRRLNYKRGNYDMAKKELKQEAINRVNKGESMKKVANDLGLRERNLNRWLQFGAERRKGAGRKVKDIQMETELYQQIIEKVQSTQQMLSKPQIKKMAMLLSNDAEFKASKGWYNNFKKRYSLETTMKQELNQFEIKQEEAWSQEEIKEEIKEEYEEEDKQDNQDDQSEVNQLKEEQE